MLSDYCSIAVIFDWYEGSVNIGFCLSVLIKLKFYIEKMNKFASNGSRLLANSIIYQVENIKKALKKGSVNKSMSDPTFT